MNSESLIKSGAHFGHPVSKWNPQFKKFILSIKNGVHIINMDMTIEYLDKALSELSKLVQGLSLIHILRCRRRLMCRSLWSPYH